MKRFAYVFLFALVLVVPLTAQAQLFGDPIGERAPWAFEASIFANLTNRDLGQVNDHVTGAPVYFYEDANPEISPGIFTYTGFSSVEEFQSILSYDLRLGFRFQNFHFGFAFTQMPEEMAGYEMEILGNQPNLEYNLKLSSREYAGYVGYLHPINDWLSVGPMLSYGVGTIGGSLTDFANYIEDGEIFGSYTPLRTELRGRVQLTRFVTVDLGGGFRSGKVMNFEADFGVNNEPGFPDGREGVPDYQKSYMELDMSGWYFSGGLTLVNPMGLD